jgi:hypothetical protein
MEEYHDLELTMAAFRRVLDEPQLAGRVGTALAVEGLHGAPRRLVVGAPDVTDDDRHA